MDITVSGRHVEVTQPIKDYAKKKIENIDIDFPRIIEAHMILDVEKYRHIAELLLKCNAHITIEATEISEDMYASIDKVVDKAARQMRKYKTKIQKHRPRNQKALELDAHVYSSEGMEDEEGGQQPRVVRTEKMEVKPMFVDEALLQMEVSERQFMVFLNADSNRINVVYRRKKGDYGLIVPSA